MSIRSGGLLLLEFSVVKKAHRIALHRHVELYLLSESDTRASQAALQDAKPRSRLSSALPCYSLASSPFFLLKSTISTRRPHSTFTHSHPSTHYYIEPHHGRDVRRRGKWSRTDFTVNAAPRELPEAEELLGHSSERTRNGVALMFRPRDHVSGSPPI